MKVEIEIDIGVSGARPTEVLLHRVADERVPAVFVIPEQAGGTEDSVSHLVTVEVREREARSLTGELVVGDDGIFEPARLAHDGKGAVPHRDNLGKSAGLEF